MNRRYVVVGVGGLVLLGVIVLLVGGRTTGPGGPKAGTPSASGSESPTPGPDSAGGATAAPVAAAGQVDVNLRVGVTGTTLYTFDASGSQDGSGAPLRRFRFDFGDGDVEESKTGKVEHAFDYSYEAATPLVTYNVVITGYDGTGKTGVLNYKVEIDNAVGQELRDGRLLVEGDRCTMAFSPESQSWFCTATIRNSHAEAVTFEGLTLFYEPSGQDLSPELRAALADPRKLRELKLLESRSAQPVFPAKLEPNKTAEISIEVPDRAIAGGTLGGVSITATGKGVTSGKPARVQIRASLGARRTWMSEGEVKRAGLPAPPASLDMPGPALPQPGSPPPTAAP